MGSKTTNVTAGDRFGRLLVKGIKKIVKRGVLWDCLCDCGQATTAYTGDLNSGDKQSCGCLRREMARGRLTTHGLSDLPEFIVWSGMRQRCNDPGHVSWHRYGGRGIKVCDEWSDFLTFYRDMGPRPSKQHTIERIQNDGDYTPANCRWATRKEQGLNTTWSHLLTHKGITQNMSAWADQLGISYYVIRARIQRGWSTHEALTKPIGVR